MPDASGRFRGISVPELPWLRERDDGDEVLASTECERCNVYVAIRDDEPPLCAECRA